MGQQESLDGKNALLQIFIIWHEIFAFHY